MSQFLGEMQGLDNAVIKKKIYSSYKAEIQRLFGLRASGHLLPKEAILSLVSPAAAEYMEPMAQLAKKMTAQRFGRTVQIYAPLYVSNYCANECVYCGFNARNQVARRTLNLDEVMQEGLALHDKHIHQLLLVTGECPNEVSPDYLAEIATALKPIYPSIAVEVYPLEDEGYKTLSKSGVDGLTIYQETYDRETYAQAHPGGPKRNYEYRLATAERGGGAGFRQLGIGALLGLADWRLEAYYLMLHALFLSKHYWKSQVSISFPRLRPAAGGYQPPHPVTDRELVQMICALRLVLPDVGLVLSTRESPQFRDSMIGIGVTKMSAGSRTSPGGYLDEQGHDAEEQFAVHDTRTVEEVVDSIRSRGYDPVYKDWDKGFEG